jgi:hypothetical protein
VKPARTATSTRIGGVSLKTKWSFKVLVNGEIRWIDGECSSQGTEQANQRVAYLNAVSTLDGANFTLLGWHVKG